MSAADTLNNVRNNIVVRHSFADQTAGTSGRSIYTPF
jgi:hypothetical protein